MRRWGEAPPPLRVGEVVFPPPPSPPTRPPINRLLIGTSIADEEQVGDKDLLRLGDRDAVLLEAAASFSAARGMALLLVFVLGEGDGGSRRLIDEVPKIGRDACLANAIHVLKTEK